MIPLPVYWFSVAKWSLISWGHHFVTLLVAQGLFARHESIHTFSLNFLLLCFCFRCSLFASTCHGRVGKIGSTVTLEDSKKVSKSATLINTPPENIEIGVDAEGRSIMPQEIFNEDATGGVYEQTLVAKDVSKGEIPPVRQEIYDSGKKNSFEQNAYIADDAFLRQYGDVFEARDNDVEQNGKAEDESFLLQDSVSFGDDTITNQNGAVDTNSQLAQLILNDNEDSSLSQSGAILKSPDSNALQSITNLGEDTQADQKLGIKKTVNGTIIQDVSETIYITDLCSS